MKTFLDSLLPNKNENYNKAKDNLKNIKERFDGFTITFPDIAPNDIMLFKEQWEDLPKTISRGVKFMGVRCTKEYKSFLGYYESDSFVTPHRHPKLYEYGKIIKGKIKNELTGDVYEKGDEYVFSPNQPHYMTTNGNECIVYTVLTKKENFNIRPLSLRLMKNLKLT